MPPQPQPGVPADARFRPQDDPNSESKRLSYRVPVPFEIRFTTPELYRSLDLGTEVCPVPTLDATPPRDVLELIPRLRGIVMDVGRKGHLRLAREAGGYPLAAGGTRN